MSRSIGANVGSMLDNVVTREGIKLSRTMRLIGFKISKVPPDKMTIPACKKQRGYILIGPPKGVTLDIRRVRAFDWTLHPVGANLQMAPTLNAAKIQVTNTATTETALKAEQEVFARAQADGDIDSAAAAETNIEAAQTVFAKEQETSIDAFRRNGITYSPSMVLAQRMRVECEDPNCYKGAMWVDEIRRRSKKLLGEQLQKAAGADKTVREAVARTFTNKVLCKCGKLLTPKYLIHRRLVAVEGFERAEPVFQTYDDPELKPMLEAFETEHKLQLPRVWAIYRQDRVPTDIPGWSPQDETAARLEARVQRDGHTIRPWALAFKATNYKGALVTFLMDAPPNGGMVAGWISEDMLFENITLGYKVRLLLPRVTEYSV